MTRKTARKLCIEMARRIYLNQNGTLKGFGKVERFYDRNWRPDIRPHGGYKAVWNSELLKDIRQSVGM